jgi:GNAT superfamily N-acetyltransferase
MPSLSLDVEPADSDDVRRCLERYCEELDRRFDGGFDQAAALPLSADELTPPRGLVILARLDGQAVGCGGLKLSDPEVAEIKRLWLSPEVRGRGWGGRLLAELEARAAAAGRSRVRLDSNRSLVEAIAMYRGRGYRDVLPFNDERFADHWFEKDLRAGASTVTDPAGSRPAAEPGGMPWARTRR